MHIYYILLSLSLSLSLSFSLQDLEVSDATKTVTVQPNNTMVVITDLLVKINYAFIVSYTSDYILSSMPIICMHVIKS